MHRMIVALVALALVASAAVTTNKMARETIEIQLHLRSARHSEAEIDQAFWDRANPDSKLFRQHLNIKELIELVGASDKSIAAAEKFLTANGARAIKVLSTRDVVVGHVQLRSNLAAFGLAEADFFEVEGFKKDVRSAPELDVITTIAIGSRKGRKARVRPVPKTNEAKVGLPFPGMLQTPQTLWARYKIPSTPLNAPSSITQGVAEFQESEFYPSNIKDFSTHYNLPQPTIEVVGPNSKNSQDDVEGTLDLEYVTAVSGGAKTYWISQNQNSTNPDPFGIDFTWWCDEVLSITPKPPSVVSISWGIGDFEYTFKTSVLLSDNRAFRKLGLTGISVFAASGDSGPGSRQYLSCSKFMPSWPASSPYVTSVGATYANSASEGEIAVSFSGGGFSDVFAAPSYQNAAISKYLSSTQGLPKASFYNASGRGFPDVSALGTNFNCLVPNPMTGSASYQPIAGTSAASPTFAATVTRVNAERAKKGQPTVGFLNPKIYQLGHVGYDVTQGQNLDTDCFQIFTIKGFPANTGWDPVSGLGTPDYEYLLANL